MRPALVYLVVLTAVTGVAYPLAVTGLAALAFPAQARGGVPGAVGQAFTGDAYFHGRPSALPTPYDPSASGGSNLGPTNPAFLAAVRARAAELRAHNPDARGPLPADLVTASASGLDPDLSPVAAAFQVPRVARARGLPEAAVAALVAAQREERWLGVFGEPRINVVRLNAALDARARR